MRFLILLFLLLPVSCIAQEIDFNEKVVLSYMGYNPFSRSDDTVVASDVDSHLLNCIRLSGNTTMGDIICYNENIEFVEKRITQEYSKVYTKLDNTDKQLFKESQDSWERWFKKEKTFLQSVFHTQGKYGHGREHSIAQVQWLFQMARQRLIALRVFNNEIYN